MIEKIINKDVNNMGYQCIAEYATNLLLVSKRKSGIRQD